MQNIFTSLTAGGFVLIFCGHRGCGKSTELRKQSKQFAGKGHFFAVYLDTTSDLDPNNIEYPDILMALANQLFEKLDKKREADT